jgi:Rab3 GTPase-activating protein catalytic subunit
MGDQHDTFSTPSIPNSAPPGRLVSVLCTHMTGLRSLCSMAVVWCTFCQELREQWEQRRSLLNLHIGIAPTTSAPETMGAKSTNAGQLNSMEPNPDLSDVLIQQKLQVLNVCVECQNAIERVERRALEQRVFERRRDDSHASDDELFFDSNEGGDERDESTSPSHQHRSRLQSGNGPSPQRRGARCPVQGSTLRRENSQLYAPYLQRPVPLTGDVITERRVMMERQKHTHVGVRLEIARRLQEPKLRSDMQAFKAANPGSMLEDFLAWYGNPKSPMDEYMNDDNWAASSSDASLHGDGADDSSVRSKSSFRIRTLSFGANPSPQESRHRLDRAAEAIRALEDTREFWQRTWNAADPVAADEQQPLFDAANTVERVFDYLETLHPASLLCQVMAANLCTSFFVLTVSAGDATNLGVIQRAFESVRAAMEHALKLLSDCVVSSLAGEEDLDEDVPTSVLTVPTIVACERACSAFSEAEVLLSRASSLLNKFPGRYELVESVLTTTGTSSIDVRNTDDRMAILELVENQQRGVVPPGECPEASVRDYLLRSLDSPFPSQLLVHQCSERDADGTHHGSLALAIAKCSRD